MCDFVVVGFVVWECVLFGSIDVGDVLFGVVG